MSAAEALLELQRIDTGADAAGRCPAARRVRSTLFEDDKLRAVFQASPQVTADTLEGAWLASAVRKVLRDLGAARGNQTGDRDEAQEKPHESSLNNEPERYHA